MTNCKQCNNTGSISCGAYLDCTEPGCTWAETFRELDVFLGQNGWGVSTHVARAIFKYSRDHHELDLIELSGNQAELIEQQRLAIAAKQARIDSLIAAKQEAEQRAFSQSESAAPSGTVNTPEFERIILSACIPSPQVIARGEQKKKWEEMIAHIDAHAAAVAANALEDGIERGYNRALANIAPSDMDLNKLSMHKRPAIDPKNPDEWFFRCTDVRYLAHIAKAAAPQQHAQAATDWPDADQGYGRPLPAQIRSPEEIAEINAALDRADAEDAARFDAQAALSDKQIDGVILCLFGTMPQREYQDAVALSRAILAASKKAEG